MAKDKLFSIFKSYPNLTATTSKKSDGNCYFAATGDAATDKATPANRAAFLGKLDIPYGRVVSAGLVHSGEPYLATSADGGKIIQNIDALFSHDEDLFLSITIADCLPVFLFDPKTKAYGIVHAGWRGLAANVILNTVRAMEKECGARAETLLAGIGPGIGACHFEVKDDVAKQFARFPETVARHAGQNGNEKIFIDLKAVAQAQLRALGVSEGHIEISSECTCKPESGYFSWRRDKPPFKQTMMAVIGLRR